MPNGSRVVILASAGSNLAIAATKFAAGVVTGSSSMLTEAVHSVVDTVDQGLLLLGQHRAKRPPDPQHPFGHGLELYFWSFVVALLIFSLGGAVSIYEGFRKLSDPQPIRNAWINIVVLAVAFVLEGVSLWFGWREYRRTRRPDQALWSFLRGSKDPAVVTAILENAAALLGLVLAFFGVAATAWLGLLWADGVASIAIGSLLVVAAAFLANETRSLLTGEAAPRALLERVAQAVAGQPNAHKVEGIHSLQLGPEHILLAVHLGSEGQPLKGEDIRGFEQAAKACDVAIGPVFIRVV